jgi:hypothetical protein
MPPGSRNPAYPSLQQSGKYHQKPPLMTAMSQVPNLLAQIATIRRAMIQPYSNDLIFRTEKVSFKRGILRFLAGVFRRINHSTRSDPARPARKSDEPEKAPNLNKA